MPEVLENVIYKGDIAVTIGLGIKPGQRGDSDAEDLGKRNPDNRAAE